MSKNTISALRDELHELFRGLKAGTIEPKVAKEMNNTAGKAISSVKVQLEGYHLRKEKPPVTIFK